jgi:hypothetical protein
MTKIICESIALKRCSRTSQQKYKGPKKKSGFNSYWSKESTNLSDIDERAGRVHVGVIVDDGLNSRTSRIGNSGAGIARRNGGDLSAVFAGQSKAQSLRW